MCQSSQCQQTVFICLYLCPPDEQRSSVNESSSLLGGSPQRHCQRKNSPYHTGQLHPAVRVADLLQHINQMKTSEGYGFKQEYEVREEDKKTKSYNVQLQLKDGLLSTVKVFKEDINLRV